MHLSAENIDTWARALAADLEPAISAGAMGIGAALQDVIAPYPPPPAASTYQRTGQDQQGWRIRQIPMGAVLENRVAHAVYLHGTPGRTKVHRQSGWIDEETAKQKVVGSGQAARIMRDALADRLEMFK